METQITIGLVVTILAVIILAGSFMAIVGYGFIRHWLRTGETWEATQERKEREARTKQP
ncbi:hypothetical protein [Pseudomonas sp. NBRC 100443]|uniref:hypothetical protein n=1 Tax=Pseudomonas sp. NBRC 100443 TaxID=1113665 RepID=UPI0024A4B7E3|nr:hypothetical protein [Pseudomonas sp. NBRC 100443]GLU36590.1 hypothetical protein Pssp01_06830 [Pseudomonas sp. NBRC 100443]